MEFFDKLGKKASEAYKITADKTGRIAKDTKNKLKIGELKSQINDIYKEIGRKVYEKHIREEEIDIKKDLEEQCIKIDVLSDDIEALLKECLELKDKKQCPKCYKEIEKEDKFCPNCGEKQIIEDVQNEESFEGIKNSELEDNDQIENQVVIEELETKNNLEKTVQVESNVELNNEEENN